MSRVHANPDNPGTLWHLPRTLRRLLLLAPPLLLTGLTALHPNPDPTPQALMDAATWFTGYHMIQLALVGLVATSVFLLADDLGRASAWPTCLGMGAFLLFFGAYDTLAGMGTGLAMQDARELTAAEQQAVFDIVKDWPALELSVFWLSVVGTIGWVIALGYLAISARAASSPLSQWLFMALAAFFLLLGHPAPFGTLAFGSLFIAALVHDRQAARPGRLEPRGKRPAGAASASAQPHPRG